MSNNRVGGIPNDIEAAGEDVQTKGRMVSGRMGFGEYRMTGKIWLSENRLNRSVLGRIFCLDPKTILLQSSVDNRLVGPSEGGKFPLDRLDVAVVWNVDGEPARKYGVFNGYATVKTIAMGVLDFALLLTHIGLLSTLYASSSTVSALKLVCTIFVSLCMVLEIVIVYLLYIIAVVDVDGTDGQETPVGFISCCGVTAGKRSLHKWNNLIALFVTILTIFAVVTIVFYILDSLVNVDTATTG